VPFGRRIGPTALGLTTYRAIDSAIGTQLRTNCFENQHFLGWTLPASNPCDSGSS